jgi:hypothetical protein
MVDALERARSRLGAGGSIVDLRPATRCLHEVWIVSGSRRYRVGRYVHPPNSAFVAADDAVRLMSRRGLRRVARLTRSYRLGFASLRELQRYARAQTNGRLVPRDAKELRRRWSRRAAGDRLEMLERFQVTVLRTSSARA